MIKSTFSGLLGVALLSASSAAFAIPTDGGISFSSKAGSAFSFDEQEFVFDSSSPNAVVNQLSGEFQDYFASGDEATFFSFFYDPLSNGNPLWEAESSQVAGTTLQFNLAELNEAYKNFDGMNSVALEGTGTITDGNSEIFGLWNLTANEGEGAFSWSSSAATPGASAVPEPGTLGLMGLGMLLLGLRSRRIA